MLFFCAHQLCCVCQLMMMIHVWGLTYCFFFFCLLVCKKLLLYVEVFSFCFVVVVVALVLSTCCNGNCMILGQMDVGSLEAGSEDASWILCSGSVGSDVDSRKKSFPRSNLSSPPMLLRSICHRDHVASPEVQLAALLRRKII